MKNFDAFTNRDLQNFKAMLTVFLSEGITDVRAMQERLETHLNAQFRGRRADKIKMSLEARKRAKENKERLKKEPPKAATKPKPTTDTCPDCGEKDWRMNGERQPDGSVWWYEGCAKCGYIQPIEVK